MTIIMSDVDDDNDFNNKAQFCYEMKSLDNY